MKYAHYSSICDHLRERQTRILEPMQKIKWKDELSPRCSSAGTDFFLNRSASLVEYALLIALVAIVSIGALGYVGGGVNNTMQNATKGVAGDLGINGNQGCPGC